MTKRALITGITGQDGAYLAKFLLEKGYLIFGTYRKSSSNNFWRLQHLDLIDKITLLPTELMDSSSIFHTIKQTQPDEIYHLAAQSFVGTSFDCPVNSGEVTGLSVTRILEAVRAINRNIKVYLASTIELYGRGDLKQLTENTDFRPTNPYAVAKLYGYWISNIYREGYDMFTCNGILFNHESPLRSLEFVTRKISNAVARIALGLDDVIMLGNLDTRRDWGYAPEYVESMWLMLQQNEPDDYIIATNETHTIQELAKKAFETVGLDWQKYVKVDEKLQRPSDVNFLQGDYSKAKAKLGWQPRTRFNELVEIMVKEDLSRWQYWVNGKQFPWDVTSHLISHIK